MLCFLPFFQRHFSLLLIAVLGVIGFLPQSGNGAKILLVSAFPGMSHWLMFEHIIHELLRRGHELTAISSYRLRTDGANYTDRYHEVLIEPIYDFEANGLPMEVFYKSQSFGDPFFKMSILWKLGLETAEHAFESANVRTFLQREGLTFDLLIAEQFVQEAFLMFAHKYRVPIVTISKYSWGERAIKHFQFDLDCELFSRYVRACGLYRSCVRVANAVVFRTTLYGTVR